MTDINSWILHYTNPNGSVVDYNFGLLSDDSPFEVQMEIGDWIRATNDQQHGTDDATLMGRDLVGGMDLTFTLTTIPDFGNPLLVDVALDKASEFGSKWRAPYIAKTPGRYATLTNVRRGRFVVGRPRAFARTTARLRKGIIRYVAVFHTITPEFYKSALTVLAPVRTVNLNHTVVGDVPAWPSITLVGRFSTATLAWVPDGGLTGWSITISKVLATGDYIVVTTLPYARGTLDANGTPDQGVLSGSRMADCSLQPGVAGHFLFTTTGTTDGNTRCEVDYYPAYAGL